MDKKNYNDKFILYTLVLSLIIALLCLWKGFSTSFEYWGFIIIAMNFLYIPMVLLSGKKIFPIFYFIYAAILIFSAAIDSTSIYNNYTALFMMAVVVMLNPKLRWIAMVLYFTLISVTFIVIDNFHEQLRILFDAEKLPPQQPIYNYLIHIARSCWFVGIVEYVLNDKFRRKKLVLYEDERRILEQLGTGIVYQKEVVGFSENTIYRKLKAARERNGNITREELVKRYLDEKSEKELE